MNFPVVSTAALFVRIAALLAAIYPDTISRPKIKFYKNNVSPDANMTVDTFVEADFDNYVATGLEMQPPSLNDQGIVVARSTLVNITSDAGSDPQTVYGLFITTADDAEIVAAQRFDTPQQMGGVFPQSISGIWRISEPLSSIGWIDVE